MKFLAGILLASVASAAAEPIFQNLDFESAEVSGAQPNSLVPTSSALPGWQATIGTTPQTQVGYDAISIGSPFISLIDSKGGESNPRQL
jgi:hypothetical protein